MTAEQPINAQETSSRRPAIKMPDMRTLYTLFLLGLGAGYLLLVWQMERIDVSMDILAMPPTEIAFFMLDVIVRITRHFIPIILGWMMAATTASTLLLLLYDLPDLHTARGLLRRLWAENRISGATITVTPKTIEAFRDDSTCLRVGGPCLVKIPVGNIATTEVNSRFKRLLPAGVQQLGRFEYIHAVLDLHPQERTNPDVRLYSRESLEVTTHVSVTFRIHRGTAHPNAQEPFPYEEDAVKKLAYAQTNLPNKRVGTWDSLALGAVIGALSRIVSTFSVDDLLQDSYTRMGSHLTIRRQTEREARAKLGEHGIELMRIRIGRFRFPDDVAAQHMQNWRINWELVAKSALAEGEAGAQTLLEIATAEAELDMVRSMVQEVKQAQQEGYQGSLEDIVALRFIDLLDRLARQSESSAKGQLIDRLQNLQNQLKTVERLHDGNPAD